MGLVDFLTGETILDSGSAEKNIDGTGKLQLSWKSSNGGGLAAGDIISIEDFGEYFLEKDYVPTPNSDGSYTWSPSYISTDSRLTGILFFKVGHTADGEEIELYTFSVVGPASIIIEELSRFAPVEIAPELAGIGITVSFDGDNVKSAAQKIASALGTNMVIIDGTIQIGKHDVLAAEEYFDRFVVLGGTRNMGKTTLSDEGFYAAVTQRLRLPAGYPHSVYPAGTPAEGHMTKLLIFDDIYPKMELQIASAAARTCYVLDEKGKHVVDHYENDLPVYKKYAKWYITLSLTDGSEYGFSTNQVIQGKPLGILFQSGVLTGREFDLAYFDHETNEHMEDDVEPDGFTATAGMFRIIMQADGDTLLPSLPGGLCPAVGDKVMLTGVALDDRYKALAQQQLLEAAQQMAGIYMAAAHVAPSLESETTYPDFLTEGAEVPSVGEPRRSARNAVRSGSSLGDSAGDYIVTSVTKDLITGAQSVQFGTFRPKGLIESMVDKLEQVSVSGGGYVGEGQEYSRNTAPMGIDQFRTLYNIVGIPALKTVYDDITEQGNTIAELDSTFEEVKNQSDRKFDIFFGDYTPLPNEDDPDAEPNYPACDWDTETDKADHVQDLFTNTLRNPGTDGGRVWRWEYDEELLQYYWKEVTDADTLAALEKIRDVASDGKLSAGAEKASVLIDWRDLMSSLVQYRSKRVEYGVENTVWNNFYNAVLALFQILNGGRAYTDQIVDPVISGLTRSGGSAVSDGTPVSGESEHSGELVQSGNIEDSTPLWLTRLDVTETIPDPGAYRAAWNLCYSTLAILVRAVNDAIKSIGDEALQGLRYMADDGVLTPQEKRAVLREWLSVVEEYADMTARAEKAHLANTYGTALNDYTVAFNALGQYLHDPSGAIIWNGTETPLLLSAEPVSQGSSDLYIDRNEDASTGFNGATFSLRWETYFETRSALNTAISVARSSFFVSVSRPSAPYYEGDLWMKLNSANSNNGTIMYCIHTCLTAGQESDGDWINFSNTVRDPRSAIGALLELVYQEYGESVIDGLSADSSFDIHLGSAGTNGTSDIYFAPTSQDTDHLTLAMRTVYALLGQHTIHVYNMMSSSAVEYDCCCIGLSFNDPLHTQAAEAVKGGAEILMFNGDAWEVLKESTTGVIQNLGKVVRLLVFGSENGTLTGSGFVTQQDMAGIFSGFTDQDGSFSFAQIGTFVTKTADGDAYITGAKISADNVDVSGKVLNFSGATSINLNAPTINLNAEKITWCGRDVIPGGSGSDYDPATQSKFYVDANGNVTMNNLKAVNGEFSGRVGTGSFLDIGTAGNNTDYIRLDPAGPSICGFHNGSEVFSLSPYAIYNQQGSSVQGARLKLGNSEYGDGSMRVVHDNNTYLECVPSAGLIHMMNGGSTKYMSVRIDNGGILRVTALWGGFNDVVSGELYRDGSDNIKVKP